MYKSWCASAADQHTLSRDLEAHLNEYAQEVVSVSYAISRRHYVLAVYKPVEPGALRVEEAAVSEAELIIDQLQN